MYDSTLTLLSVKGPDADSVVGDEAVFGIGDRDFVQVAGGSPNMIIRADNRVVGNDRSTIELKNSLGSNGKRVVTLTCNKASSYDAVDPVVKTSSKASVQFILSAQPSHQEKAEVVASLLTIIDFLVPLSTWGHLPGTRPDVGALFFGSIRDNVDRLLLGEL